MERLIARLVRVYLGDMPGLSSGSHHRRRRLSAGAAWPAICYPRAALRTGGIAIPPTPGKPSRLSVRRQGARRHALAAPRRSPDPSCGRACQHRVDDAVSRGHSVHAGLIAAALVLFGLPAGACADKVRVDPARNMLRFYAIRIAPTLFGEWAVVREWGRIGSPRPRTAKLVRQRRQCLGGRAEARQEKERRGYQEVGLPTSPWSAAPAPASQRPDGFRPLRLNAEPAYRESGPNKTLGPIAITAASRYRPIDPLIAKDCEQSPPMVSTCG